MDNIMQRVFRSKSGNLFKVFAMQGEEDEEENCKPR
jgi:hypothetical protein